jgi:Na+-transporting methylmalonyl-CoA/oxaloacetate decarboxylase gamma subunit
MAVQIPIIIPEEEEMVNMEEKVLVVVVDMDMVLVVLVVLVVVIQALEANKKTSFTDRM